MGRRLERASSFSLFTFGVIIIVEIKSGIYAIVNLVNGKMYIGSSVNMWKRWVKHRYELNRNTHHSQKLQRAWVKYGKTSFVFISLEVVEDKQTLISREQWWLNYKNCVADGYNVLPTAGSCLGRVMSEEQKIKTANSNRGQKRSEEVRKRMSDSAKKKVISQETREKMAAALRGRPGKKASPETRAKISAAQVGRKLSEAHRKSLSEAQLKRQAKLREERAVNEDNSPTPNN